MTCHRLQQFNEQTKDVNL